MADELVRHRSSLEGPYPFGIRCEMKTSHVFSLFAHLVLFILIILIILFFFVVVINRGLRLARRR